MRLGDIISVLWHKKRTPHEPRGEKALVLSGGGVKGIFEVGALEYLLKERRERFRIVCGVSAGALNGVMVAQGLDYFEKLREVWFRQAETGLELIQDRFTFARKLLSAVFPPIAYHRLGEMDGIQDNTRLFKNIIEFCKDLQENLRNTGTHLRIGVVSLQTGKYYALNPLDPALTQYIPQVVLSSTAVPIAFSPGKFSHEGSEQWIDGGVNQVTPIEDALEVAEAHEIPLSEVIAISSAPLETEPDFREFKGLLDIGLRVEHILATEIDKKGFEIFQLHNALVQIHQAFQNLAPKRRVAFEKIFENALGDHYSFLSKRRLIRVSMIYPDPDEWTPFREEIADRYPIKKDLGFWKEFPQILDRSGKRLYLAYEFGYYMAKKLYSSPDRSSPSSGD